jgi:hypothetical protein
MTGSKNANDAGAISEPNSHNAFTDCTKAEESRLSFAMLCVLRDYPTSICECKLCFGKADAVFESILLVLRRIPLERGLHDLTILRLLHTGSNTIVWLRSGLILSTGFN